MRSGMKKSISVKEAAELLGSSEQFVRIGLQRDLLPIGTAIQIGGKKRYTYHISPRLLNDYIGGIQSQETKNLYKDSENENFIELSTEITESLMDILTPIIEKILQIKKGEGTI